MQLFGIMRPFARELLVRAAVGMVALPVVGWLLWLGRGWSAALFSLAGIIAAYELYRLTPLRAWNARWIGIVAVGSLPMLPWIVPELWPEVALALVAGTSMATWISLLLFGPRGDAPTYAGHAIAGFVFVSTGLTALAVLRMHQDGFEWAATVLIVVWANDTGAFLGGKLIGSRKLIPTVSPGKTREGLVVGALVGLAGALAAHLGFAAIARTDAIAIAIIAAVFGPMGDLCKSMMKRAAGVKDAGKLFLAHGGMLDRIDAVLFVAPPVLAYLLVRS